MPSYISFRARVAAFVFAAGALLSACQVDVVEDRPRPVPSPDSGGGNYCTREYQPVCARRGSRYRTFDNSCVAEDAGFRIVSAGECGGGNDGGGGGGVAIDRACPKTLDPVCAKRGGDVRTFANDCRADEAGFRVIYAGECNGGGGGGASEPGDGGPQQYCTKEYVPVCARRGSRFQTFPNQCEAENAGFRVVSDGTCQ
jgi:hypothetical protein